MRRPQAVRGAPDSASGADATDQESEWSSDLRASAGAVYWPSRVQDHQLLITSQDLPLGTGMRPDQSPPI